MTCSRDEGRGVTSGDTPVSPWNGVEDLERQTLGRQQADKAAPTMSRKGTRDTVDMTSPGTSSRYAIA
jgi:hypothetical protein